MKEDIQYRKGFNPPFSEIYECAYLLKIALDSHLRDEKELAAKLIVAADNKRLGEWIDSIWLAPNSNLVNAPDENLPGILKKECRYHKRMPDKKMKSALIERDGHHCKICGIPLIRSEVRKAFMRDYPQATRWTGVKANEQHRGFQVMWLQYDHLLVHSRGGETTLDNMIIACAACNFGRDKYSLKEVGFADPFLSASPVQWSGKSFWHGLEAMLPGKKRMP